MPKHMIDSDQPQEHGHESEHGDGSLDDMMKQFQQLIFRDDSSSPTDLPKSSQQQNSLTWMTSAHVSGPSGLSQQQQNHKDNNVLLLTHT